MYIKTTVTVDVYATVDMAPLKPEPIRFDLIKTHLTTGRFNQVAVPSRASFCSQKAREENR